MNIFTKVNNYKNYIGYAASFNDDEEFKVFNLAFEYDGYSGAEKFAISTNLTEDELYTKYGEDIVAFEPFVLLTREMGMVMVDQHRNDEKFRKRATRSQEVCVGDIIYDFFSDDSSEAKLNKEIRNDMVITAVNKLSKKSRERIINKYYYGKTDQEIATESGYDRSTVSTDIRKSLKKLKIMLVEMGVCA